MGIDIVKSTLRFILLLAMQGLVVNRLDLVNGQILPQVYLFAILMLPIETPRLLVLFASFLAGLFADMFTGTPGMHASACVLLGFLMPLHLRLLSPREGYEFGKRPTIQSMGLGWYLSFATPLVLVHHLLLFYLEAFRFEWFFVTLSRVLLSAAGTMILLLIAQYLIFSSRPQDR